MHRSSETVIHLICRQVELLRLACFAMFAMMALSVAASFAALVRGEVAGAWPGFAELVQALGSAYVTNRRMQQSIRATVALELPRTDHR